MPSIAAGVFELKDSDEDKWYRLIDLPRVEDTIYVLHCCMKNTSKTEKRDLRTAEQRWKLNLGAQVKLTKPKAGKLPSKAATGKPQKRATAWA